MLAHTLDKEESQVIFEEGIKVGNLPQGKEKAVASKNFLDNLFFFIDKKLRESKVEG